MAPDEDLTAPPVACRLRANTRRPGRARLGVLVLLATLMPMAAAGAPPALPEPLTREAIRELVARLGDAEVRALLIAQLDRAAAPAAQAPGGMTGMVGDMAGESERMRRRARELVGAGGTLPAVARQVYARLTEGRGGAHPFILAAGFLAMLGAGWVAERGFRHVVRDARRRLDATADSGTVGSLAAEVVRLGLRLLLDLVALATFAAGAAALFFAVYQGHEPSRRFVLTYLAAVLLVRLVALGSRLLLSPAAPALRLLPLGDRAAGQLHSGAVRLGAVYAFGIGTLDLLRAFGVPGVTVDFLNVIVAVVFLALALDTLWRVRGDIASLIRGPGDSGPLRRQAAELWPVLATAYFLIIFVARVTEVLSGRTPMTGAAIGSVVLVVALPVVDLALCRILSAVFPRRLPLGEAAGPDPGFARPGSAPYLIRREAYTRILKAFGEEGIRFAHRQVTVFTGSDSRASGGPGSLAAAAAATTAEPGAGRP